MRFVAAVAVVAVGACTASPTKKYGPLVTLEKVETVDIKGGAYVEPQHVEAKGEVVSLTKGDEKDGRVNWTIVVNDARGPQTAQIQLPASVLFPPLVGANAEVSLSSYGGGPNVIGMAWITDDRGLVLAINSRPPGWSADRGRRIKSENDDTYDTHRFTVKMSPKSGPAFELRDAWTVFEHGGIRYVGEGSAVARELHGNEAPPDYVGSWIDFTIIRYETMSTPEAAPVAATPAVQPPAPAAPAAKKIPAPKDVVGYVRVMGEDNARVTGTIKSLTSENDRVIPGVPQTQMKWTFVVGDGKQNEKVILMMPIGIPPPFVQGDEVIVNLRFGGGGPNRRGELLVLDKPGNLLMSVGWEPAGWKVADGKKTGTEKANGYSEAHHEVNLTMPDKKSITLTGEWAAVDVAGVKFYAHGSAVHRTLDKGKQPVPDYVGGWRDFTLVKVPSN